MRKSIVGLIAGLFVLASGVAFAERPLVAQVADILAAESAKSEIKVGILEYSLSGGALSEKTPQELADIRTHITEDFEADVFQQIKKWNLQERVSFIERTRLNAILEEKKMSMMGLTEQNAASIGNIAGLDYIIMPSIRISGDITSQIAKVIRVKDARTVDIAKVATNKAEEEAAEKANQLINESFSVMGSGYSVAQFKILSEGTDLKVSINSDREVSVAIFHESAFSKLPDYSTRFVDVTDSKDKINEKIKQGKAIILKNDIQAEVFNVKAPFAGKYILLIFGKAGFRIADGHVKVAKISL